MNKNKYLIDIVNKNQEELQIAILRNTKIWFKFNDMAAKQIGKSIEENSIHYDCEESIPNIKGVTQTNLDYEGNIKTSWIAPFSGKNSIGLLLQFVNGVEKGTHYIVFHVLMNYISGGKLMENNKEFCNNIGLPSSTFYKKIDSIRSIIGDNIDLLILVEKAKVDYIELTKKYCPLIDEYWNFYYDQTKSLNKKYDDRIVEARGNHNGKTKQITNLVFQVLKDLLEAVKKNTSEEVKKNISEGEKENISEEKQLYRIHRFIIIHMLAQKLEKNTHIFLIFQYEIFRSLYDLGFYNAAISGFDMVKKRFNKLDEYSDQNIDKIDCINMILHCEYKLAVNDKKLQRDLFRKSLKNLKENADADIESISMLIKNHIEYCLNYNIRNDSRLQRDLEPFLLNKDILNKTKELISKDDDFTKLPKLEKTFEIFPKLKK